MPRDNRLMYMAHVCFYVCCSDSVEVCGNVCCVAVIVKDSVVSLRVLKYVVCLCKGCDGCCVFLLYCGAWSCRCLCMGSMSVSSCTCCMFVSCVHPHDLRRGDIFVLCWAMVRRVRRGGISSQLLMCGGVCSILLLPLVARCLETID